MSLTLYFVTFTTSFVSMAYAMITATLISDFTGEEILSQCLTMGPYLLGLGLGSYWGDKVLDSKLRQKLWQVEWLSALLLPLVPLFMLVGIFFFQHLSPLGTQLGSKGTLQFYLLLGGLSSLLAGLLGGAQLPLILKITKQEKLEKLLAVNYLGPLFAGPFIVFCSSQNIIVSQQIITVALIQMMGLLVLIPSFEKKTFRFLSLILALLMLLGLRLGFPRLEYLTAKSGYVGTKMHWSNLKDIDLVMNVIDKFGQFNRIKTPYQVIEFYTEPPSHDYGQPSNSTLYLNRHPQFDVFTSTLYHQSMVYGALNVREKPTQRVLILGAGDGLLLKEFKSIPEVKKVTMVELDSGVMEFAKENPLISFLNQGVLKQSDPRFEIIVGDAVSFLRTFSGKEKYDLIMIDFPFPNGHELSKLYSYEFYRSVKKAMALGATLILDMPVIMSETIIEKETLIILKTLTAAFNTTPFVFGPNASFVILNPDHAKPQFNYQRLPATLALSARANFIETLVVETIDPEVWKHTPVNSMFLPGDL